MYRIPVRWPNGDLAYHATSDQEAELRAARLVDEVRSPGGLLRHLRLHRGWNLLLPDGTCVVTRHINASLTWKQQPSRAKFGRMGNFSVLHFKS